MDAMNVRTESRVPGPPLKEVIASVCDDRVSFAAQTTGARGAPRALGGRSNVAALRLENAGVRLNEHGQLLVNEHF